MISTRLAPSCGRVLFDAMEVGSKVSTYWDFVRCPHGQCVSNDGNILSKISNRNREVRIGIFFTFIQIFLPIYDHIVIIGTAPGDGSIGNPIIESEQGRTLNRCLAASASHGHINGIFAVSQIENIRIIFCICRSSDCPGGVQRNRTNAGQ